MATWADFEAGAPSMAARGLEQLRTIPVGYLATVRNEREGRGFIPGPPWSIRERSG